MADYVGQQFGRYRLHRLLGTGGFAQVYLGVDVSDGSQFAVKIFTTPPSPEDWKQMQDEARRMAQAESQLGRYIKYIVHVREVGIDPQRNMPFLAMEYAPNGTMRQRFPSGVPFPLYIAVEYVRQVAEALQAVHDAHLVHRDVKPGNLLLNANDEILLGDFGIARDILPGSYHATLSLTGTAGYMGPEQLLGKPGPQSDQYSLGVIAYEWLTGLRPFEGATASLIHHHLTTMPGPLTQKNPNLPAAVSDVVLRALAKDPDMRWPSVQHFSYALAQAARAGVAHVARGDDWPTAHVLPEGLGSGAEIGTAVALYQLGSDAVKEVFLLEDRSHLAAIDANNVVYLWDMSTDNPTPKICPVDDGVLSPDRAYAARFLPNAAGIEVYDLIAQVSVATYTGHTSEVSALAWSPDKHFIASAEGDGTKNEIHVWEALTGRRVDTPLSRYRGIYRLHSQRVTAIAWSFQCTHIVSCDEGGHLQLWNAISGAPVVDRRDGNARVIFLKWSPDHRHVLLGGAKEIRIWDTVRNVILGPYPTSPLEPNLALWSPPYGRYLAARTGTSEVTVWSMYGEVGGCLLWNTNRASQRFKHTRRSPVYTLGWSPDGKALFSGGAASSLEIWKPRTGHVLHRFQNAQEAILSASWSPDGRLIASGSTNNQVRIWLVEGITEKSSTGGDVGERTRVVIGDISHKIGPQTLLWLAVFAPFDAVIFPLAIGFFLSPVLMGLAFLGSFLAIFTLVWRYQKRRALFSLGRRRSTRRAFNKPYFYTLATLFAALWAVTAWAGGTIFFAHVVLLLLLWAAFWGVAGWLIHQRLLKRLLQKLT